MSNTYNNQDCAERARHALQAYVESKGERFENNSSEIIDLITDLLHLAADLDEDPIADVLRMARMHYEAEQDEARP